MSDDGKPEQLTLGDALPAECARVRALIVVYSGPELHGAGKMAIRMMEAALKRADAAMIQGDLVGMIHSYAELQGFTE